jgi:hypothetical protein
MIAIAIPRRRWTIPGLVTTPNLLSTSYRRDQRQRRVMWRVWKGRGGGEGYHHDRRNEVIDVSLAADEDTSEQCGRGFCFTLIINSKKTQVEKKKRGGRDD